MTFSEFTCWFKYKNSSCFDIILLEKKETIGSINSATGLITFRTDIPGFNIFDLVDNELILQEFEKFKKRPEYLVGTCINLSGAAFETAKEFYESLLTGSLMCRAFESGKDPDKYTEYITKVLNWVDSTDFYQAPASTIYHEAFPHGLLYHTLSVYNKMIELYQIPTFCDKSSIQSATLCCLMHDWCKIGLYEKFKKNVKDEKTGQWEKVDAYRRGTFDHPFGHGAASMYMALKFVKLSEEEALAIRWHMSRWNVSENEQNEYQQACEDYPLVHLIQFADQLAIVNY